MQPQKEGRQPSGNESLVNSAVKTLVSLASSAEEADKVIQNYNPDLKGENTPALIAARYQYISDAFGLPQEEGINPETAYPSRLSLLGLRKYGDMRANPEPDPDEGYCSIL